MTMAAQLHICLAPRDSLLEPGVSRMFWTIDSTRSALPSTAFGRIQNQRWMWKADLTEGLVSRFVFHVDFLFKRLLAIGILLLILFSDSIHAADRAGGWRPEGERILFAKIKLPVEQTASFREWLQMRYEDCRWLDPPASVITASFDEQDFADTYFDTPDLRLLAANSFLRYREPAKAAAGSRDVGLLQLVFHHNGEGGRHTSKISYPARPAAPFTTLDDAHPMFALVQVDAREKCEAQLRSFHLDPEEMRRVMSVERTELRMRLADKDGQFFTLTTEGHKTKSWGMELQWTEIELKLDDARYSAADQNQQRRMEDTLKTVKNDILTTFFQATEDQTPIYKKSFATVEESSWLPVRRLIFFGINHARLVKVERIALGWILLSAVLWCCWSRFPRFKQRV